MEAQIRQLFQPQEPLVDTMTEWMYQWWGKREGYTVAAVREYVRHGCQRDRLPRTYGLFLGEELIGMYQLRLDDLFVRPEVYPWLANVYLAAAHRGKGYGRVMLSSVREKARLLEGCRELFLYTTHTGLYEKYGWELVGEIDTHLAGQRMQRLYRLLIE